MKIPLPVKCANCGKESTRRIHLDQTSFDWTCDKCGHLHPTVLGLEITMGFLLAERARFEFEIEKDFSMSIVLSAIALDCELSRQFFKWNRITIGIAGKDFDTEEWERKLPKNFIDKMMSVCEILNPNGGIEGFVSSSQDFSEALTRFPSLNSGSLAKDFHKSVFKPRNAILHQGVTKFGENDAIRIYTIALFGLQIIQAMDLEKRKSI